MKKNEKGYLEGDPKHSKAIHRQIAYKEIYRKNRNNYPLPFSKYIVHHIDEEKLNNSSKNLFICIQEDHDAIHNEQRKTGKKFKNSKEIEGFLEDKNRIKIELEKQEAEFSKERKIEAENKRKATENKKIKAENERKIQEELRNRRRKIIIIVIILIIILLISFIIFYINENKNLIVKGLETEVFLKNNQDKDISVKVTYRTYTNGELVGTEVTRSFFVNANSEKKYGVNSQCFESFCSVKIINYEEM